MSWFDDIITFASNHNDGKYRDISWIPMAKDIAYTIMSAKRRYLKGRKRNY